MVLKLSFAMVLVIVQIRSETKVLKLPGSRTWDSYSLIQSYAAGILDNSPAIQGV